MFFYKVEGHMPKLSSFGRGKTKRPKKSLTNFLHTALQLILSLQEANLDSSNVVPTFESVYQILKCDYSSESYSAVLSCGAVYYAVQGGLTFECSHSNES